MAREYLLKLDRFEGPLDLLLHLIRVHEIDIFDIDVFLLTNQYLGHLRVIEFRDLTEAGEFLEIAAQLIEIKSKMLLPREKIVLDDGSIIDDDPREPLKERLLEYEKIKHASQFLESMQSAKIPYYAACESKRLESLYEDKEGPLLGDPSMLCILYGQMLVDFGDRKPNKVQAKRHLLSVEEKIEELKGYMTTVRFALFQGFYAKFSTRYEMVVHILAVLELIKMKFIRAHQEEMFGPLWIYTLDTPPEELPFQVENIELTGAETAV